MSAGLPLTGPTRSHSERNASTPYTTDASMKLLSVFFCCRTVLTPVPVAAGVREKSSAPVSLAKDSSGSVRENAIGSDSPGVSSRSPRSWSRNCPHAHPHCDTLFSEKRF